MKSLKLEVQALLALAITVISDVFLLPLIWGWGPLFPVMPIQMAAVVVVLMALAAPVVFIWSIILIKKGRVLNRKAAGLAFLALVLSAPSILLFWSLLQWFRPGAGAF